MSTNKRTRKANIWVLLNHHYPDFCVPLISFTSNTPDELFHFGDEEYQGDDYMLDCYEKAKNYFNVLLSVKIDDLEKSADEIIELQRKDHDFIQSQNTFYKPDLIPSSTCEELEEVLELDQLTSKQKSAHTKQVQLLYKLIAAMAIDGYAFDFEKKKSEVPSEIRDGLNKIGLDMDPQTIRKHLAEAKKQLPDNS